MLSRRIFNVIAELDFDKSKTAVFTFTDALFLPCDHYVRLSYRFAIESFNAMEFAVNESKEKEMKLKFETKVKLILVWCARHKKRNHSVNYERLIRNNSRFISTWDSVSTSNWRMFIDRGTHTHTYFCERITLTPLLQWLRIIFMFIEFNLKKQSYFIFQTEITHRFQTARPEIRTSLLQCLLPWLENMELVAANVSPASPLSYIMVSLGDQTNPIYSRYPFDRI